MTVYRERKTQPEGFSGDSIDLWCDTEHVGKAGRWAGTILYVYVDTSPVQDIGLRWELEKISWSGVLNDVYIDRPKLNSLIPNLKRLSTLELRVTGRINGKGQVKGTILFDPTDLPVIQITRKLKFIAGTPQL